MLLLAHIDNCPVINLPGCSRSPKLNGLDWVMQRLAAGLPVGKTEILSMGWVALSGYQSPLAYA